MNQHRARRLDPVPVPEDLCRRSLLGRSRASPHDTLQVVAPRWPVSREDVLHDDEVELDVLGARLEGDRVDAEELYINVNSSSGQERNGHAPSR